MCVCMYVCIYIYIYIINQYIFTLYIFIRIHGNVLAKVSALEQLLHKITRWRTFENVCLKTWSIFISTPQSNEFWKVLYI
jgi:hypothetical protein